MGRKPPRRKPRRKPRTPKNPPNPKPNPKPNPNPAPAGGPAPAPAPAAPSRPFISSKLALAGGSGYLLYDQLNRRYGGGVKLKADDAGSPDGSGSGSQEVTPSGEPPSSTDVGTASNPSQEETAKKEELPFWVKNQAHFQKEVDKGTGFIQSPDGSSSTEFYNRYNNSQLRDPNSPMSRALARMNRDTANARQAAIDRESIQYGNVPISASNRQMLNNPVAYTNQSPARGAVGNSNMLVNTSTPVGAGVANPNSPIQNGGAFGNTANLGLGMQSFSVPQTRAEIDRNLAMQSMNGPEISPEVRARLEAENAISGTARNVGNAISGAYGTARDALRNIGLSIPSGAGAEVTPEERARIEAEKRIVDTTRNVGNAVSNAAGNVVNTAKDVLRNASSYIPAGARGEAGAATPAVPAAPAAGSSSAPISPSASSSAVDGAGTAGGEDVSLEELQAQADAVMEERRNTNLNFAQTYSDIADSIGYNIEDGNLGYEDGLLGDAIDLGLNVSGDMYTASLLGQAPSLVKNTLTGQYGAKSAAALGRNETVRSTLGKQAWKQTGQAMAQSYAKGASTVGGVARAAGTGAMRLAGKAMPYYSLIDAAYSGGEELLSDNGVRTAYHGGGAKGKAMGAGAAVLNGLTMGAYDTIAANYGPSDYAQKTGASKDPLGTAWLTEQFYNKFIK